MQKLQTFNKLLFATLMTGESHATELKHDLLFRNGKA